MKFRIIFYFIALSIISLSCNHDKVSVLEGCCGNPALDEAIGNGHIYLPNIFTPNGDNINDLMTVYGDSILLIINMQIKNSDGRKVFETSNIIPGISQSSWDGYVDGVVKKGLYTVSLEIEAEDGTIGNFESKVCNFPCGDTDMTEKISGTGCQFPAQNDDGHYNSNLNSYEQSDCYE
ncbi:MAG: gliding motility-associated C-terminal domain-containing protein [Saprospiraceae bacterium]